MVFQIGKYKYFDVEDVINEDPDYCIWFINNVSGNEFVKSKIKESLYGLEFSESSDISKFESEILIALQKNGREENEAKTILNMFKKKILKS